MARYRYSLVACARWEETSIVEWLEYHKSVGFDHVYLYSNDDDRETLLREVTAYVLGDDPFVTYRHWPERGNQINIYFHFLEHCKHETEWYSFLDIDEFFVFKNCNDVGTFMCGFADVADCIYFNWVCFGNDGRVARDEGSTLLSYLRRAAAPDVHTKMLCRSDKIDAAAIRRGFAVDHISFWHFLDAYRLPGLRCRDVQGRSMDGYSADFPASATPFATQPNFAKDILDRAYVAHYQFRSEEDFMRRWRRGGSAWSEHWRTVYESGEFRRILASRNAVYDDYLARYWHRYTALGGVARPEAANPANDAAAHATSSPGRDHDDNALDRTAGRLYGADMGPVGICAIFKNEAPNLLEWIAYHLSIGFDHVVLFDNASDDNGAALVEESVFKPFVTIIHWPGRPGQLSAYQHFSDHYAKAFEWVAFIDIDEFIHPLDDVSVRDVLPRFEGMSGVSMQWLTFGSSGHDRRPSGLVIENYTMRLPASHKRCSWVKPLVRASDLIGVFDGPHVLKVTGRICNARGEPVPPHAQIPQCHDVLVVNHYYTKSMEDWEAKHRRGQADIVRPAGYETPDFAAHEREAAVHDDRMMRFVPLVKQAMDDGPLEKPLPVSFDTQFLTSQGRSRVALSPAAPAGGPVIHVEPNGGRFANQMIHYMAAIKFASLVPGCRIANVRFPEWGIDLPPIEVDGETVTVNVPHRLDMAGLSQRMIAGEFRRLSYKGFGHRMENLLDREHYRSVFSAPRHRGVGYGADHLVCHVRADDILRVSNSAYVLTPVEFYQEIVAQTGLHPVLMGETGPSLYMDRLRAALPGATILAQRDIVRDFETIRQSENIVVSCSSFCWLAAWLSDARQIIMPVNGMMNPRHDGQVDLLPLGDARYRFHLFPINYAVPDLAHPERHRLIKGLWREVSHDFLQRLLTDAPRAARRIEPYLEVFDEAYYVARFPSVAKGIADGWLSSGREHFTKWGFADGFGWWSFDLDEDWYTTRYPMAAFEIAQGDYVDCRHHYLEIGRTRGYKPRNDKDRGHPEA